MKDEFFNRNTRQLKEQESAIELLRIDVDMLERIVGRLLLEADARESYELEQGEKT